MPAIVTPAADFLEQLLDQYDRAAAGAEVARTIDIGGVAVRLRFASPELAAALLPPLAHLRDRAGTAALTVFVTDQESTGIPLPATPWTTKDYRAHGAIAGYNDARFRTAFPLHSRVLTLFDSERNTAVVATPSASGLPFWERGAPFLTLFHWALAPMGLQLVHAAGIGNDSGAILLAGRGGSGKSTTALAALVRGFRYLGDDYCLVAADVRAADLLTIYSSAKATRMTMELIPELEGRIAATADGVGGKNVLSLSEAFAERIAERLPLRAVVVPKVAGEPSPRISSLSPADVLRAVAPSTLLQLGGGEDRTLQRLADLVGHLPAFELALSRNLDANTSALERLLADLT